jgi:tRNA G37 N-methylase Trm5
MDCPEHADAFVDVACQLLKTTGGIIHIYGFAADPTAIEVIEQRLRSAVTSAGWQVREILYSRKLRPIAPHRWQIVVDAFIHSVP